MPRAATAVPPSRTAAVAAARRSASSYHRSASWPVTCRWMRDHVGRAPRRPGDGRRAAASPASRSSRWAATSASSVAGCSRTASKQPGTWRRAWRTAPATTGVDTGRRPAPASRAAPSSSARRYTVRNDTPARPSPAGQGPAGGHADVVGGHHDGDGGQPVGRLRLAHERGEAVERRRPVGLGVDVQGHGSASYEGGAREFRTPGRGRAAGLVSGRRGGRRTERSWSSAA